MTNDVLEKRPLAPDAQDFPAFDVPRTEADITLPRAKPRSLLIPLAYRAKRIGKALLGRRRLLRACLNAAWLLKRFAFELSGEEFGPAFHCLALGLSEDELRHILPVGGSLIDIGCGSGRWCRLASPYASRVVGIDYDETHIANARNTPSAKPIEYYVGDVTKNLSGQHFDVALLIHVLEHIEDVDAILRSVRRQVGCPYWSDADHVREYTLDVLEAQLTRNGWQPQWHKQRGGTALVVAKRGDLAMD